VQGSRPAVGPNGEVYATWSAVDTSAAAGGADYIRFRQSADGGESFGSEQTVALVYSNFGSGAPGFNRGYGFLFPGIAVDRTSGPYGGRVYVVWNESINYFDDVPAQTSGIEEVEPNNQRISANSFGIGETVHGSVASTSDVDYFQFSGLQGESVILYLDSLDTSLDVALRLLCGDDETRLAYSAPAWAGRPRVVMFTLPRSGIYHVRITPLASKVGGYRLRTGRVRQGPERARDHRDVFVAYRDRGGRWSAPALVNDDPPTFDNWLPEIAVSGRGRPYITWYDWRDFAETTCGGWSHVYLARSDDGGDTWTPLGTITDQQTDWTVTPSSIAPNQGDYIALFANDHDVIAAWADGRDGDPDVYMARHDVTLDPPTTPFHPRPAIEYVTPNPTSGEIRVGFALASGEPAWLELLDLSGRRWSSQSVAHYGPGRHATRLREHRLPAGIYVVLLRQRGERAMRKLTVVP
jgi:hypothetical protein